MQVRYVGLEVPGCRRRVVEAGKDREVKIAVGTIEVTEGMQKALERRAGHKLNRKMLRKLARRAIENELGHAKTGPLTNPKKDRRDLQRLKDGVRDALTDLRGDYNLFTYGNIKDALEPLASIVDIKED